MGIQAGRDRKRTGLGMWEGDEGQQDPEEQIYPCPKFPLIVLSSEELSLAFLLEQIRWPQILSVFLHLRMYLLLLHS